VKIPEAMRIRGYSQSEAIDRALQMQVLCEAEKIKGGVDRQVRPVQRGVTEEGGEVCGRRSDHQDAAVIVVVLAPPTAWDLADCMRDGRMLIGSLANVVKRLHKWETTPRPGRRGTSCGWRLARLGGGLRPGRLQE
jgi:hypothetical protein